MIGPDPHARYFGAQLSERQSPCGDGAPLRDQLDD